MAHQITVGSLDAVLDDGTAQHFATEVLAVARSASYFINPVAVGRATGVPAARPGAG
jgi:hypothetical protein